MVTWALVATAAGFAVLYYRERRNHLRCMRTLNGEQEMTAQLIEKNAALQDELDELRVSSMRRLN